MFFPTGWNKTGKEIIVSKFFDKKRIKQLIKYGKKYNATLNDIFVTATIRAFINQSNWNKKDALRLAGTVDLRRYFKSGQTAGICNLSAFYFVNLIDNPGNNFEQTLLKVKKIIDRQKENYLGLPFAIGAFITVGQYPFFIWRWIITTAFKSMVKHGNMPPGLTNMGPIKKELLDFGHLNVKSAHLVVPPCFPPFMVIGMSGYDNTVTLTAGFFESSIPKQRMVSLFDRIDMELPSAD